jgi:hypothetical protein
VATVVPSQTHRAHSCPVQNLSSARPVGSAYQPGSGQLAGCRSRDESVGILATTDEALVRACRVRRRVPPVPHTHRWYVDKSAHAHPADPVASVDRPPSRMRIRPRPAPRCRGTRGQTTRPHLAHESRGRCVGPVMWRAETHLPESRGSVVRLESKPVERPATLQTQRASGFPGSSLTSWTSFERSFPPEVSPSSTGVRRALNTPSAIGEPLL